MNILFLTISNFHTEQKGIYSDLLREMKDRGHNIYVMTVAQRREGQPTTLTEEDGIQVLRIRTGNITKCNLIEKGITTLLLESQFVAAIKHYFRDVKFDLVTYSTPPITFSRTIRYVKKSSGALSYLQLKDIFPQNAVDMGMMKKKSALYRMFREKERKLYAISDYIGCMSQANCAYVLRNNMELDATRVELCPNAVTPTPRKQQPDREQILKQIGIPADKTVYIYGGNLGRPQGVHYLIACIRALKDDTDKFFLVVGSGTEYGKLSEFFENEDPKNAKLFASLPKAEYEQLVSACDVGLIFLDKRFTIPNFPSRVLTYLEAGLAIITATDTASDIGDMVEEAGAGIKTISGELDQFIEAVRWLGDHADERVKMGQNGLKYLLEHYTAAHVCDIILGHFTENQTSERAEETDV